jgi:hypothetical protein
MRVAWISALPTICRTWWSMLVAWNCCLRHATRERCHLATPHGPEPLIARSLPPATPLLSVLIRRGFPVRPYPFDRYRISITRRRKIREAFQRLEAIERTLCTTDREHEHVADR